MDKSSIYARKEKEIKRLKKIFKNLPKDKMAIALPLIEQAAFMRVTLDDLAESIAENGVTEDYKNGANQFGRKATAESQTYNAMIKNYNTVTDRLEKMLPDAQAEESMADVMGKLLND